jgi:hypothetical protein
MLLLGTVAQTLEHEQNLFGTGTPATPLYPASLSEGRLLHRIRRPSTIHLDTLRRVARALAFAT